MRGLYVLGILLGSALFSLSAIVLVVSGLSAGVTGWEPVNPSMYYGTLWSILVGGLTMATFSGIASMEG